MSGITPLLLTFVADFGEKQSKFQWLISEEGAIAFARLISSIGIRNTKSQVAHELALPRQARYLVPIRFTPVELFNYQQRYKDAVLALQAGLDLDAVTHRWRLDAPDMVRICRELTYSHSLTAMTAGVVAASASTSLLSRSGQTSPSQEGS